MNAAMASSEDQIGAEYEEDQQNACDYQTFDKESLIEMLKEKDKLLIEKTETISRLERELNSLKESQERHNNETCEVKSEHYNLEDQSSAQTSQDAHSKSVAALSQDEEKIDGGEKPMPQWTDFASGLTNIESSITDVVRATAEAEMGNMGTDSSETANSEYVYDESSGYYYHPSTGYYWDPNSSLFYDYTSGTYYHYDEKSGEYKIHSQVDIQAGSTSGKEIKSSHVKSRSTLKKLESLKERIVDKKKRRVKRKAFDDTKRADQKKDLLRGEGGNLSTDRPSPKSDEESSGSLATDESELMSDPESGEIVSSSHSSDVEMVGEETFYKEELLSSAVDQAQDQCYIEAMAENYPPCIRAIIEESDKLAAGTLFIITCAGGTIGRDTGAKHIVEIPDIGVSKVHAKIDYDYDQSCYQVTDLGSQNGTRVNGDWVGKDKSKNRSHSLNHGDLLQLGGSTKLLVHIHKGYETCEGCEPGQIQAKLKAANPVKNSHVVLSKEEKKQQQRKELKKIKKKFGLENSHFENDMVKQSDPKYLDKAYLRRKFIGSENDAIVTSSEGPASVHSPITASNKGHQLLSKMGWTEGQGLGRASSGIAEPINVEMRINQNAGLGSKEGVAVSLDRVQDSSKAKRWSQARQRFNNIQAPADQTTGQGQGSNSQAISTLEKHNQAASQVGNNDDKGLSSSSSSSSSIIISSSKPIEKTPQSKPQILWHKGGTETLSNDCNKNS